MSNQTEKEELIKQVEWMAKQYVEAAKPFTDRLATLIALEPSPPLTMDFLNSIPEGVKNAFADAVATGTGIYNADYPTRVITAESILTPPAASGQQDVSAWQAMCATVRAEIEKMAPHTMMRDLLLHSADAFCEYGAKVLPTRPSPAQQESEKKPFAYFMQQSEFGPFIECDASQVGAFAAYRYAPAPAALTDEQILAIQVQHVKDKCWSTNGVAFARAILATASAAPAEPPNDSSMPVDMSEAKRWIVQLRGRIDHLLGIINSEAPAEQAGDEFDNDYFCRLIEQTVDAGGFDVDTPAGVDAALHAVARAAIASQQKGGGHG